MDNLFKVSSWNVNSVRKRQEQVAGFLEEESPDVLCLQELKCAQDKFPFDVFSGLNYQVHVLGQKQYNGVAIFVKNNHQSKQIDFPQDEARIIGCIINSSVRIINIYAPNGAEVDSEPYNKKLSWYKNFLSLVKKDFLNKTIITGDFNITPADIDSWDPVRFKGKIFHSKKERQALQKFFSLGFEDSFRNHSKEKEFSWWSYRHQAFDLGRGLRIDLLLSSADLKSTSSGINSNMRSFESPSDHAPVWTIFKL